MRLSPSDIRFTQDSVGGRFSDGSYISKTLEQLLYGGITVDEIAPIEVVRHEGLWWALTGNRRLYLYRKLEDLGVVTSVPVVKMSLDAWHTRNAFNNRMTTDCDGLSCECRQMQAENIMTGIVMRWEKTHQQPSVDGGGRRGNRSRSRGRNIDAQRVRSPSTTDHDNFVERILTPNIGVLHLEASTPSSAAAGFGIRPSSTGQAVTGRTSSSSAVNFGVDARPTIVATPPTRRQPAPAIPCRYNEPVDVKGNPAKDSWGFDRPAANRDPPRYAPPPTSSGSGSMRSKQAPCRHDGPVGVHALPVTTSPPWSGIPPAPEVVVVRDDEPRRKGGFMGFFCCCCA